MNNHVPEIPDWLDTKSRRFRVVRLFDTPGAAYEFALWFADHYAPAGIVSNSRPLFGYPPDSLLTGCIDFSTAENVVSCVIGIGSPFTTIAGERYRIIQSVPLPWLDHFSLLYECEYPWWRDVGN